MKLNFSFLNKKTLFLGLVGILSTVLSFYIWNATVDWRINKVVNKIITEKSGNEVLGTNGLWYIKNGAIRPVVNSWSLGSEDSPLIEGNFTHLRASTTILDTVYIENAIKPGPLSIATTTAPIVDVNFEYDENTGIDWVASDKMSLMTGGSSRLTVDSSGNVGIGTTSPLSALHVVKATEQLRLGYDSSNYTSFTSNASG
ncbi:MAG: hypothetical protein WCW77_00500, partial [Patescibacteria group bacterium]